MSYTRDVLARALEGLLPEVLVQRFRYLHVVNRIGEEVSVVVGFQGMAWYQQRSGKIEDRRSP